MPTRTDEPERPFFATAAKGTEGALRDELREMRIPAVRADRGGVHFGGSSEHPMRVCLRSRIAIRVLERVVACEAPDADALYAGVYEAAWERWLDAHRTLSVAANVKDGALRHSGFVSQRVKDAVVDRLRDRFGARPDVDRSEPDVHVVAHIQRDRAQIFIDYAGAPLSRRGYRTGRGAAPMRETLAAAILRLAGYRPGRTLLDPMCGSGTLPIEAAMWSYAVAPGARREFGFQRWRSFDDSERAVWQRELERAEQFAEPHEARIEGADIDRRILGVARGNAERAGVKVRFSQAALDAAAPEPGTLVVLNPPYGVRLVDDGPWRAALADLLARTQDCDVAVISPDLRLPDAVESPADGEHTLFNGDIECRLFTWRSLHRGET